MGDVAPLIAFVCEANVCRSPLAADLFQEMLAATGVVARVRMGSAGSRARLDLNRCSWRPGDTGEVSEGTASFDSATIPTQVTSGFVDEATVCLAADRQVQAALIRLSPGSRSRIFTVKEAAALAHLVLGDSAADSTHSGRLGGFRGWGSSAGTDYGARDLDWLVAELDAARGWLPVETGTRRRFQRARYWSQTFDVPDAHVAGKAKARHSVMFSELNGALTDLVGAVSSIFGGASSAREDGQDASIGRSHTSSSAAPAS